MLAVMIKWTPGHQNLFIVCQDANVGISVSLIKDVKTLWNSILELLEQAN
jgi:hypothetical protein